MSLLPIRPISWNIVCTGEAPVKTIFVLDDDEEQAELLAEALASKAWTVRAFSDPIRALAALNAEGADLLIADLSMPWIDGGDVVASARVRRPTLKVILVSGYPRGQEIAERYQIQFFSKPIDLDALRKAVDRVLHTGASLTL
jgi:DNA-binding NtrC family response regulator